MSAGCPFCEIASGKEGAHRVYEGLSCVAFLDARPLFPGHVLIVPRNHRPTLAELDATEITTIFTLAQHLSQAIQAALSADGTFVAMNNRVSQSVAHAHVHVVPRRKGDGLRGFFWPRHTYASPEEAAQVAAKIRTCMTPENPGLV